jgi:hypothetical protein
VWNKLGETVMIKLESPWDSFTAESTEEVVMRLRKELPGQIAKVEFPVGISALLTVGVFGAAFVFWRYPQSHDLLTFLGSAFAMVAAVVAAYYIGKTLQITVWQRDAGLTSEKVDKAFTYIHRWNTAPLDERKQWWSLLNQLQSKKISEINEILSEIENRTMVVEVLNFFEEMCLAINEGLADEVTLMKFFRTMLDTYYSLLYNWIHKQRTDPVRPRPRAFIQFEAVAKKWQQRN